jgi:hypothetical protein
MACVPGYQQEIQSTINGLFKQISHNIPVAGVDTWRVKLITPLLESLLNHDRIIEISGTPTIKREHGT